VASSSDIVLPLPFFLGEDTAIVNAQVPYADIRLKAEDMKFTLDTCEIGSPDVELKLERSLVMNYVLKPFAKLPASFVQDIVCNSISGPLGSLKNRIEIKIPLIKIIPPKFIPSLIQKNTTLLIQLQSIQSRDEQFTMVAGIEWGSSDVELSSDSKHAPTQADTVVEADDFVDDFKKYSDVELSQRHLELWAEDKLFNEFMDKFYWNFEWLLERIPMDSDKIPQSTRDFLGVLCSDCYFELKVSAAGAPHLETRNKTLVLSKRDQIFLKVVNPSRSKNSILISFYITLTIQVIPKVENGVFRTQVNLLNTSIEMEKGAFPKAWNIFVEDLVRGMVNDVIWLELKKVIEKIAYSDGLQIPRQCGVEPTSIQIYVDDSRFGVSASLVLEQFSAKRCLRQFKETLPDPAKIFDIKETS